MGSVIAMPVSPWSDRDALFAWAATPAQRRNFPEIASSLKPIPYCNRRRIEEGADFSVTYLYLDVAKQGLKGLYLRLSPSGDPGCKKKYRFLMEKTNAGYLAVHCCGWEDAKEVICCYLNL